ncbi:cytidylate kinase [uncultured Roseburia sp.]|uniref:Cytidylate kinase-like family protein n=1 Tax=Brotonthovivens ammoniilytica TaxID=2981725 RepID=A0ABT2TH78_9FIRM|nr:cytidylate kinase-like family protein [Brotonthovivens ammoniilytica]MCU6761533.1 cytidylate kinase-like family protein [Brotonthovivens ammoniilytica]SCI31164.1 cytidylate kinase [uncultured Roseburia sp.]
MIITIGREYGSGGREIGKMLAKRLNLPFYDKKKLLNAADSDDNYEEMKDFYEEKPINSYLYAIEENQEALDPDYGISKIPFQKIRALTALEGGVIIGRCANYIFRGKEDAVSVFIHASEEHRIAKIAEMEHISIGNAKKRMHQVDEQRAAFHHMYTKETWGAAKGYELCLDSGVLGVDRCVELIIKYLEWRG